MKYLKIPFAESRAEAQLGEVNFSHIGALEMQTPKEIDGGRLLFVLGEYRDYMEQFIVDDETSAEPEVRVDTEHQVDEEVFKGIRNEGFNEGKAEFVDDLNKVIVNLGRAIGNIK